MKALWIAVLALGSINAQADGFVCETIDGDLNVKVYNNTLPRFGTRSAAVMIVSDPVVRSGRKTIAKFTEASGLLSSSSATYKAKVDLRFANSNRSGELIGGTKLGQLKNIGLKVNFTYAAPMADGEMTTGVLVLDKRNGDRIVKDVNCARYLKN